jgi:nucleoside-diphosphate-sugar epimerase
MARLALVTGASTGIGRACALHLAGRGFDVLAGVRNPADAPGGLEPLRLDITSETRRYGALIAAIGKRAEQMGREGLPPEEVAEVVGEAITAERPRTRYVVGRDAKVQAIAARLLPDRAFDALISAYLRR